MRSQLDVPPHVSSLVHAGYLDWKYVLEQFRSHELSKEHINMAIAFTARLNAVGRIDTALAQQVQPKHQYWTSVLKRVVSVVKFIAKRGLAFRGSNELIGSPGNGITLVCLSSLPSTTVFSPAHIEACESWQRTYKLLIIYNHGGDHRRDWETNFGRNHYMR